MEWKENILEKEVLFLIQSVNTPPQSLSYTRILFRSTDILDNLLRCV